MSNSTKQAARKLFVAAVEANLQVGEVVRSTYAKRWTGTVLEVIDRDDNVCGMYRCLTVRQEVDRCGRPIPKNLRKKVTRNACFFVRA